MRRTTSQASRGTLLAGLLVLLVLTAPLPLAADDDRQVFAGQWEGELLPVGDDCVLNRGSDPDCDSAFTASFSARGLGEGIGVGEQTNDFEALVAWLDNPVDSPPLVTAASGPTQQNARLGNAPSLRSRKLFLWRITDLQ